MQSAAITSLAILKVNYDRQGLDYRLPTRYEYANGISLDAGPPGRAWPLFFSCARAVILSRREDR